MITKTCVMCGGTDDFIQSRNMWVTVPYGHERFDACSDRCRDRVKEPENGWILRRATGQAQAKRRAATGEDARIEAFAAVADEAKAKMFCTCAGCAGVRRTGVGTSDSCLRVRPEPANVPACGNCDYFKFAKLLPPELKLDLGGKHGWCNHHPVAVSVADICGAYMREKAGAKFVKCEYDRVVTTDVKARSLDDAGFKLRMGARETCPCDECGIWRRGQAKPLNPETVSSTLAREADPVRISGVPGRASSVTDQVLADRGVRTIFGKLGYAPVVRGSVVFHTRNDEGTLSVRDDRHGLLIGDVACGEQHAATIDYATGEYRLPWLSHTTAPTLADYEYDAKLDEFDSPANLAQLVAAWRPKPKPGDTVLPMLEIVPPTPHFLATPQLKADPRVAAVNAVAMAVQEIVRAEPTYKPGAFVWHAITGEGPWILVAKESLDTVRAEPDRSQRSTDQLRGTTIEDAWTVEVEPGMFRAIPQATLSLTPVGRPGTRRLMLAVVAFVAAIFFRLAWLWLLGR